MFNVSEPLENYTVWLLNVSNGYQHIFHKEDVTFRLQVYEYQNILCYKFPGGIKLSVSGIVFVN